jgi:topoisomerase-4 subunit A
MPYVKNILDKNFMEYASYVIKDRAIPDLEDGLKPVQRRILHSLYEMDDGKFNKVANVVGHTMSYHPHGDASIYAALVVLANKDLFIEKQGNFGNIHTGDPASAARYIECRLLPLAKEVLINPQITAFEESYDGRKQEPMVFPAKVPVVLIQGAEGIAVGMATHILPHNFVEVLEAVKARLKGKKSTLYPDFPTSGLVDVSEYADGNGKVRVRAKLDLSDPKRIVIRELPYGHTCDTLIASIESAARQNKIKIQSIEDYTAENVEIEIKLARGVYSAETVDALFAFTGCESSVSVNFLVIKEGKPTVLTVSQVIAYQSQRLTEILTQELKLEESQLKDKLHARTLEQIFVEERIYKRIESMKTREAVSKAVMDGFKPFSSQIKREVTLEDVERLLKIPIRRISLYDINQARKEIEEIKTRLKEIKQHLGSIVKYAISFLDNILKKYGHLYPRRTEIISFEKVNVREVAMRNLKLKYDKGTGYLGYEANGNVLLDVSQYDRILVIRKTGAYSVMNVPDKLFVDKGMWYCGFMDAETSRNTVFTIVFRDNATGYPYIKRCKIEQFILNKGYALVPDNCTVLRVTTDQQAQVQLEYKPKPRLKVLEETFGVKDYLVKGAKAGGVRLANKEVKSARILSARGTEDEQDSNS